MPGNRWAITCKDCGRRIVWEGPMDKPPACLCKAAGTMKPAAQRTAAVQSATTGGDVEEAMELGEEILSLVDDLPTAGEEFGESVAEKTRDIIANIETHQRVTNGQMEALGNMRDGLSRWFHD